MIQVRVTSRPAGPIVGFDLENRPLAYWYDGNTTSEITAFSWKVVGKRKTWTMLLRSDGMFDADGEIIEAADAYLRFREVLSGAGLVFGHNIRRHDLPILNAGLIRLNLPPLDELKTSDTCRDLPKRSGMSYSLENLVDYLGIKGTKYTMSQPKWEDANRLTDSGLALARKRVTSDVLLQERLRAELLRRELLGPSRPWKPS